MEDMDNNASPQPKRVLRAADVVPPYNNEVLPPDGQGRVARQVKRAAARTSASKGAQRAASNGGARDAERSAGPSDVPTYDLAENVLAEHRQIAARRRRGPGRNQVNTETPAAEPTVRACLGQSPPDLLEMQRIVAQIVTRDIELLCKGPARPSELQ